MVSEDLRPPTIKNYFVGFQGGSAKALLIALAIDDKDNIYSSPVSASNTPQPKHNLRPEYKLTDSPQSAHWHSQSKT